MLTELFERLRQKTVAFDKGRDAPLSCPSVADVLSPLMKKVSHPGGLGGKLMLRTMNLAHVPLARWGFSFLSVQPGQTVLDIGCGGGANLKKFLEYSPGVMVKGLDLSETSVSVSRSVCAEYGSRAEVKQGGAEAIPWPDEEFDLVTAFETVYFWPDLPASFREVARVLKPGGLFQIVNSINPEKDSFMARLWRDALDIEKAIKTDYGLVLAQAGFEKIQKISGVKMGLIFRGSRPAKAGD
jgi:SAM-dependent methyltransferase